jgi:hypothetical protein
MHSFRLYRAFIDESQARTPLFKFTLLVPSHHRLSKFITQIKCHCVQATKGGICMFVSKALTNNSLIVINIDEVPISLI